MRERVRCLGALILAAASAASAATFTVTVPGESGPGSIGQAILSSNASPGVLDTIAFNIPGTPPFALLIFMGIPAVTDPVVIDATTQPGYAGTPLFQIRAGLGNGPALTLAPGAEGSTVRGISFADLNEAIRIEGDGNTIESCFFGTDVTGMVDDGNGIGIFLLATADDNVIGGTTAAARNLISGNDGLRHPHGRRQRQPRPGQSHRHEAQRDRGPRQPGRNPHLGRRQQRHRRPGGGGRQRHLREHLGRRARGHGRHRDRGEPHRHRRGRGARDRKRQRHPDAPTAPAS